MKGARRVVIELDGSMGEGGGQLLRVALALSLATGEPFRITRLRARRAKPGLLRQHLTCVQAAARFSAARVEGDALGSQTVEFVPATLTGGHHEFDVGTAGSTLLVVQALLPALLVAPSPSRLVLTGGTHNPAAPPFEFFVEALLPLLARCGIRVAARLVRHGFFPAGGGRIELDIEPARVPTPLQLVARGLIESRRAIALRSHLPRAVTVAECEVLRHQLGWRPEECEERLVAAHGPGNLLLVTLRHAHVCEVITSFGERGLPAAQVAANAVAATRTWLDGSHAVGEHLADQLLAPLAVLAGGRFVTGPLSSHATTALAVVERFRPGAITAAADSAGKVEVIVRGR